MTRRLSAALGPSLRAVYLTGSAAVGGYVDGSSDLDVLVAVEGAERRALDAVVESCAHERLPCPATKLELVVYELDALANPGDRPRWSLNFDTGASTHHVGFEPEREPAHWFVLDLAFARRHAQSLVGPPADTLIADVGDAVIDRALDDMVAWYEGHEPGPAADRAAERARHWKRTREFDRQG